MENRNILAETNALFDIACDKLELDKDLKQVLKTPYREIKVEVPVRDINGEFHLYSGYRIQHNGARGPYYGGLILEPTIKPDDLIALASRTAWKTGLMNIPFGGAYGGISCDSQVVSPKAIEASIRGYISRISSLIGPYKDIITQGKNVDASLIAYIMDEYGKKYGYCPAVATGKPQILSGSIARSNALVSSSYYLLDLVSRTMQMQLSGLLIAMSLPPSVMVSFIDYLNYLGCTLVAISDCEGTIYNPQGLDLDDLKKHAILNNRISDYPNAEKLAMYDIISVDCDILLLGLDCNIINSANADSVKARIVCELADAVVSMEADPLLFDRGITVIPDLLCTSGETITDYFEWIQNIQQFKWDYDQINDEMAKYINENFKMVSNFARDYSVSYRQASYMLGISRVAEATKLRGYI